MSAKARLLLGLVAAALVVGGWATGRRGPSGVVPPSPGSSATGPLPSETSDYWTDQRIRDAQPQPMPAAR